MTHTETPPPTAARTVQSLWSFTGRYRVLHLTWFAFFLTFVVWFNFAPFAATIADQLGLTDAEVKTIALCNVALTVPARTFIGMALDRWGPRRIYTVILLFAVVPNSVFALSSSFTTLVLSRLALSVVGAGFVVGIRMVSEWFPPRELRVLVVGAGPVAEAKVETLRATGARVTVGGRGRHRPPDGTGRPG